MLGGSGDKDPRVCVRVCQHHAFGCGVHSTQ